MGKGGRRTIKVPGRGLAKFGDILYLNVEGWGGVELDLECEVGCVMGWGGDGEGDGEGG